MPELRHHMPNTPILLVGLQSDRRANAVDVVTREEGRTMATRTGCAAFVECSIVTGENLDDVMRAAFMVGMEHSYVLGPSVRTRLSTVLRPRGRRSMSFDSALS